MSLISKGRRGRASVAVLASAAMVLSGLAGTSSAVAQSDIPGEDEIVSSRNMSQVANIPATPPLAGDSSVGTDIAFTDHYAIAGNYLGFTIYDIRKPKRPRIVSQVLCPGAQNDVSVSGDLLFLSVDSRRNNDSCNSQSQPDGAQPYWEGIRVFDISDKRSPRYVAAVETSCGSHTHTLVPERRSVYVYVSSYAPSETLANCQPPHDLISVIKVPRRHPEAARVVSTPVLFPDGGYPGNGDPDGIDTPGGVATSGCHDLTTYPDKDLMAGACMGDGVLFDISDREEPRVIDSVQDDENFAFWHSATFNNAATKVVFTDELGGGGSATCNPEIGPTRGANGIYDIVGWGKYRKLVFRSYFKIPRQQADTENCVAHNGSLIPVRGRDIMVQAWYQGGIWVWDFTWSSHPRVIGFWERGPLPGGEGGGMWSAYYYNGYIYGSDIVKGLDVIEIKDPRTNSAKHVRMDELNAQTQYRYGRW